MIIFFYSVDLVSLKMCAWFELDQRNRRFFNCPTYNWACRCSSTMCVMICVEFSVGLWCFVRNAHAKSEKDWQRQPTSFSCQPQIEHFTNNNNARNIIQFYRHLFRFGRCTLRRRRRCRQWRAYHEYRIAATLNIDYCPGKYSFHIIFEFRLWIRPWVGIEFT